jgi:hypothetical protein
MICNSIDRRAGYFHGKIAPPGEGSNLISVTVGRRGREYLIEREVEFAEAGGVGVELR